MRVLLLRLLVAERGGKVSLKMYHAVANCSVTRRGRYLALGGAWRASPRMKRPRGAQEAHRRLALDT